MTPPIPPPVTRTLPLFRSVAVGEMRPAPIAPVVGANPAMPKQFETSEGPPDMLAISVYPLAGQPSAVAPLSILTEKVAIPTASVITVRLFPGAGESVPPDGLFWMASVMLTPGMTAPKLSITWTATLNGTPPAPPVG